MKNLIIFSFFVCLVSRAESIHFRKCVLNDPDINTCIANIINSLKPYLRSGVPEIHLPVLDPYNLRLLYGNTKLDGQEVEVLFLGSKITGASNFTIDSLTLTSSHVDLKVKFPIIKISADFKVVDILDRDTATGKFGATFENVVVTGQMYASRDKHNREYLKLDSISTWVSIGHAELNAISVNEDSRIGKLIMEESANPAALRAHKQLLNQNTATIFKGVLDKVLPHLPLHYVLK